MKMGRVALESTRDTAAHLRNREPPNMSYLREGQDGCHEEAKLGVTAPGQWGALPPYSYVDSLPGLLAGGQVDRLHVGWNSQRSQGQSRTLVELPPSNQMHPPTPDQLALIT